MSKNLKNTLVISLVMAVLTALGIGIARVMELLSADRAMELLVRSEIIVAMLCVAAIAIAFLVDSNSDENEEEEAG